MKEAAVQQGLEGVGKSRGGPDSKRRAKQDLTTYLTNNCHPIDYPRYPSLAVPFGSPEVQAQCRIRVQARCNQSGV
jgi:hypothetical protein